MRALKSWCVAAFLVCALLLFVDGVRGDGCHIPEADIGDEAGLAADLCAINYALGRSPPDYVTAEAYYRLGYRSRDTTFINITTGAVLESSYVDDYVELFGEEAWMHDIIEAALEGEGDFSDDTKRVQVIKKLLQSSALGHLMFTNLENAVSIASSSRRRAIAYVERAMANFYGLESDCAIFGNGQARGIEFGTMEKGVSSANDDLAESFADAVLAIRENPVDSEALSSAIETIEKSFITIYLQAVVKYANRIISDTSAIKAQAEGFGYYHAVAGQVYKIDEEAHDTIYDAFNIASEPDADKAEEVLELVPRLLRAFRINDGLFGEFDDDREEYVAPEEIECEAVNPFVTTDVNFIDSDR